LIFFGDGRSLRHHSTDAPCSFTPPSVPHVSRAQFTVVDDGEKLAPVFTVFVSGVGARERAEMAARR